MRFPWIKLGLLLALWYEVTVELGLGGGAAFVLALLGCGGALMLVRMPGQVLALLGPPVVTVVAPVAVWLGLAWWLLPRMVSGFPLLTLAAGAALALAGAAARYAISRYAAFFAPYRAMAIGGIPSGISLLMGVANAFAWGPLSLAALAVIVALPLRVGWRFIGPAAPERFDAQFGNGNGFRDHGYRDGA